MKQRVDGKTVVFSGPVSRGFSPLQADFGLAQYCSASVCSGDEKPMEIDPRNVEFKITILGTNIAMENCHRNSGFTH